MPTTKHRKKSVNKRRKTALVDETDRLNHKIRIRRHRFPELRRNPDFLALIKVGRVVNAVMFGFQCISDYIEDMSPVGRRQYNRAIFLTSGYMYEGLVLVDSLKLKYVKEKFFQRLNALTGVGYKRHRKIVQEIRHSVAFHLDSDDKSTKAALKNLKLPRYDLMSGNSSRMMDFYFDLADTIDLNYLIDKFKGDRPEADVLAEIFQCFIDILKEFGGAGHEFLTGLGEKMNFTEYVD